MLIVANSAASCQMFAELRPGIVFVIMPSEPNLSNQMHASRHTS